MSASTGAPSRLAGLRGVLLMSLAALSFAAMATLIKVVREEAGLGMVIFARGLFGWLLLRAFFLLRCRRPPVPVDRRRLIARAFFGFAGLGTYTWAIQHIELGLASALNQTSPLFVAVLAAFFLGERTPLRVKLFIVAAFSGIVLIVSPDFGSLDLQALIGLSSGLFAGIAYILVRQLRRSDAAETVVLFFCWYSMLFAVPVIFIEGFSMPSLEAILQLFGIGALGMVGQEFLTYAYRHSQATYVSVFLYLTTLTGLLIGWLWWSELPAPRQLMGAGICLCAMCAIGFSQSKAKS
ncbi:MAG: DMT family transporter [Myxococcota bacterium]|jgi:drug/metabolite transporter (DMT)-like permease|nr:DMT family transporter [Myxococcota bacterium]